MDLRGKSAPLTGSTSIGLGIADCLVAAGADVVLNGFGKAGRIEAPQRGVQTEHGVRAIFAPAGIINAAACAGMMSVVQERLGSLDILANTAGIQVTRPIEEFPVERRNQVLAVELSGALYAMRVAMPSMRGKGWGREVNIAAKHGLLGLTSRSRQSSS